MPTAREQAREAAYEKTNAPPMYQKVAGACADAASDVWEPLLRDLLVIARAIHDHDALAQPCTTVNCAVKRAKEALGGTD